MLQFGCLDWDNHPTLTTFSLQFFIVYSEGICHCDIPHAPLSFWDWRSVPPSPKDNRSRIRYGLSGTSTHEPLNVNDPIYTYIPRYVLHILHNPISLLLPLHSSLLSIYVRVHIIKSYDHFHVYTYFIQWTWVWYVMWTVVMSLSVTVRVQNSSDMCEWCLFNGEWGVNCVWWHPCDSLPLG